MNIAEVRIGQGRQGQAVLLGVDAAGERVVLILLVRAEQRLDLGNVDMAVDVDHPLAAWPRRGGAVAGLWSMAGATVEHGFLPQCAARASSATLRRPMAPSTSGALPSRTAATKSSISPR